MLDRPTRRRPAGNSGSRWCHRNSYRATPPPGRICSARSLTHCLAPQSTRHAAGRDSDRQRRRRRANGRSAVSRAVCSAVSRAVCTGARRRFRRFVEGATIDRGSRTIYGCLRLQKQSRGHRDQMLHLFKRMACLFVGHRWTVLADDDCARCKRCGSQISRQ